MQTYPEFASVAKQYYESAEGYEDILFIILALPEA